MKPRFARSSAPPPSATDVQCNGRAALASAVRARFRCAVELRGSITSVVGQSLPRSAGADRRSARTSRDLSSARETMRAAGRFRPGAALRAFRVVATPHYSPRSRSREGAKLHSRHERIFQRSHSVAPRAISETTSWRTSAAPRREARGEPRVRHARPAVAALRSARLNTCARHLAKGTCASFSRPPSRICERPFSAFP